MDGLVQMIRGRVFTLLLVMLAAGFAILVLELLISDHTEGTQLVGVGAGLLGVVLASGALFMRGRGSLVAAGLLLVLSLSGVLGTYQHYLSAAEAATEEREEESESTPPPLAPLSLAGLSVITALVIVGRPEPAEPMRRKRTR